MKRLGIFGGSFDPVHHGHLLLAETCREQCGLDEVRWIPAATPPHKMGRALSAASARLEMLRLATISNPAFGVSDIEVARGGVSYTVDTLEAIRAEMPDVELFLLMGADSLRDLPTWREPARIVQLSTPVVVRRHGNPEPDFTVLGAVAPPSRLAEIRRHEVAMPVVELSSTDLRSRAASGRSLRYRVPPAVEAYIREHRLYQADSRDS